MGVVTWKNIAPSNPSGILQASVAAHKALGEGIGQIGTSIKDFSATKTKAQTDDFIADLMAAGSQEERDNMIAAANQSWLNLERVNQTNWELGAPEREQAAYEKQLASQHYFNKLMEEIEHKNALEILAKTPSKKSGSSSSTTIGGSRTASEEKGIFDPTNKVFTELEEKDEGILASWTKVGSDYGEKAQRRVHAFNNKFLANYGDDISDEDLNYAFNTGILRWEDKTSSVNDFYFELDGKKVGLKDENADEYLYEKLMDEKFNEQVRINRKAGWEVEDPEIYRTQKSIVKGQYFDKFDENNPKLSKLDLEDLFFQIWNANENSINQNEFTADSASIFKTITDVKDVPRKEWDGGWYTGPGSGFTQYLREQDELRKSAEILLNK
jgi:hypothetical protein